MSRKIGRNVPCPCGSGRKYKACCLAKSGDSDFQFRLQRRLSGELIPRLIDFATEEAELVEDAWNDFNGGENVPYDPVEPMATLFMAWFLFNWNIEFERSGTSEVVEMTIAELFMGANDDRLTSDQKNFLLSSVRCPYSLCEVVEVKPGVGMTLFDLLRRIQSEVVERTASQTVRKGEIIYCATSELHGFRSNVGTGPYPLRPTSMLDVLELRKRIVSEAGTERFRNEHLLEFEDDIRWFYLDRVAQRLAPPVLVNSDGHRMVPQKLYFDIDSADQAFHALKSLAGDVGEKSLLANAVLTNDAIEKVEFPWLGGTDKARESHGGSIALGSLSIDGRKLVIDVNSTERAETIRKIVEERLAGHARYKRFKIEPLEAQMSEMWQGAASGGMAPRRNIFGSIDFSPAEQAEIRKHLEKRAKEHWISWFDEMVPALGNMTPRKAAKIKEGRDLLESLLLEYESHASDKDDPFAPDVKALRHDLGM